MVLIGILMNYKALEYLEQHLPISKLDYKAQAIIANLIELAKDTYEKQLFAIGDHVDIVINNNLCKKSGVVSDIHYNSKCKCFIYSVYIDTNVHLLLTEKEMRKHV